MPRSRGVADRHHSPVSAVTPDFIGIGAQKAGTTWLYANLKAHPEIWFPPFKEVHYFDRIHLGTGVQLSTRRAQSLLKRAMAEGRANESRISYLRAIAMHPIDDDWYRLIYAERTRKKGDITPNYCAIGRSGIEHLKRLCPDAKIIYMIRDPLDRALSSLRMSIKRGGLESDLLKTVNTSLFAARGDYRSHVPLWDEMMGDRILYIPFGHLKTAPQDVLSTVESFIGVKPYSGYPNVTETVHSGRDTKIAPEMVDSLKELVAPQYPFLLKRFGEDFLAATK